MQNKNLQIALKIIAELIRELTPKDKSRSKLAMEYGMSTSEMSDISNAKKDMRFSTLLRIAQMLDLEFAEFAIKIQQKLPEGFAIEEL